MNKSILLFSVLLFFVSLLFSQKAVNTKIIYKATFSKLENSQQGNNLESYYKMAGNTLRDVDFVLLGTMDKSFFWVDKPMVRSDENVKLVAALSIVGSTGTYFLNREDNIVFEEKEAFGDTFLIKYPIEELNWQLHQEQKIIGNYTCHKATSEYIQDNGKVQTLIKVTAWYAPEISLSYGPKNYSGLPGLILELKEHNIQFTVENIYFNSLTDEELKKIKEPKNKEKAYTRREFEKLGEKLAREYFNKRN